MDKRYQVFVSSTYKDLIEERQKVIWALLAMNCIPAGMELFPAADEDQWTLIEKVIDECDYYLVITGGRYGSKDDEGTGYTEKEYRYALRRKKPVIGFLHKDHTNLPEEKTDPENIEKLEKFRELVQKKHCQYWNNADELVQKVTVSLHALMISNPSAIGWVRGDQVAEKDAIKEIMRLRNRVDELEKELEQSRTSPPPGIEDLAQGDDEVALNFSFRASSHYLGGGTYWHQVKTTWNDIFRVVSPVMMSAVPEIQLETTLNDYFFGHSRKNIFSADDVMKHRKLSQFLINKDDFQTVKIQLRSLGLITKTGPPQSKNVYQIYWKLTNYGDNVMSNLLAVRKTDCLSR